MEPQGAPTPSEQPKQGFDESKPVQNSEITHNVEAGQLNESLGVASKPDAQVASQPEIAGSPSVSVTPSVVNEPQVSSVSVQPSTTEAQVASAQPDAVVSQPDATQPVVGGSAAALPPKPKKRWVLPVAITAVVLLALTGGYAFAFYLPNQPGAVYLSSLKRTGEAVDTLINYSNTEAQKHYKSYGVSGKLTATIGSKDSNFDATINGKMDADGNATGALDLDVMGAHVNTDIRSIHVAGSASPDIYVRAGGVKPLLDAVGASSLDSLDNQWLDFDHTLLNSYAANYGGNSSAMAASSLPTAAQSHDALVKVQAVNKQYLFTTDSSHAVLQNKKYIGKETKAGRSVYHYAVGYDKNHLKSYVDALSTALNSSSLNNWAKQAGGGKTLSETLDMDSLKTAVDTAKPGYTFDVWVDAKTKLIQSVAFTDPSDSSAVFTLTQNYTGGSSYPFALAYQGKGADGSTQSVSVQLTVDTTTNKETVVATMTSDSSKGNLTFTVTPSTSAVQVTAPTGAKSVADLLSELGLGSF